MVTVLDSIVSVLHLISSIGHLIYDVWVFFPSMKGSDWRPLYAWQRLMCVTQRTHFHDLLTRRALVLSLHIHWVLAPNSD